jgi:putative endonuclease
LSRKKGFIAEERAVKFLQERGFTILSRNYYSQFGEIDIVAKVRNELHFVEVKSGKDPMQNMTEKKLFKILKTSEIFLQKMEWSEIYGDIFIDLITISENEINFIENISF